MAQFYPEEIIQEVRASNDITDIVSEYVKLKRSGSSLKGLCPFHSEKTPSFSVAPDKQIFHCFGCGAGGNVINFIMRIENIDFIEAMKYLAERARINLPEGNLQGDVAKRYEQKQLVYRINVEAARFFHNSLFSKAGEKALKYLAQRRINPHTIKRFGLGYAPDSWDALKTYLTSKGFDEEDIQRAGLIIHNSDKSSRYDRFRNRVIFPIIDLRSNVIAFGGRVLDDSLPKYLNSPETIVFHKSRNLYGLNFAKNSGESTLIIVEGYMDVISLQQNGIINTIASLGTALTREQANIIKKYCSEVIIAYDSDAAGQAATLRGMDILADTGCKVKILTLNEGKDPDEYIRVNGVVRFNEALYSSKSLIEYRIDLLKEKYDITNIEQKIDFVNEMADIFAKVDNAVERDVYVKKVADSTGIANEAIFSEIRKRVYKDSRKNSRQDRFINRNPNTKKNEVKLSQKRNTIDDTRYVINKHSKLLMNSGSLLLDSERELINLLCFDKSVYSKVKELIKPEDFTNQTHKKMIKLIYSLRENEKQIDPAEIVLNFEQDEVESVASILHMESNYEQNNKAALQLINTIKQKNILQDMQERLKEGNVEKLNTILMEYKKKK